MLRSIVGQLDYRCFLVFFVLLQMFKASDIFAVEVAAFVNVSHLSFTPGLFEYFLKCVCDLFLFSFLRENHA